MKPTLPFAQYDKDENHLHILHKDIPDGVTNLYTEEFVRQLQAEIEALKSKTITDEEIEQLQAEYDIDSGLTCHSVKDFARAILRKANEK